MLDWEDGLIVSGPFLVLFFRLYQRYHSTPPRRMMKARDEREIAMMVPVLLSSSSELVLVTRSASSSVIFAYISASAYSLHTGLCMTKPRAEMQVALVAPHDPIS